MSSTQAAVGGAVRLSLAAKGRDWRGLVLHALLLLSLLFSLATLAVLLFDQVTRSLPVFRDRGAGFLTGSLSSDPAAAGILQGLVGSAVLATLVALVAFPLGIATAVYLEEYARETRLTRFIALNIRNLAGVPSVVYGLLGLAVFVAALRTLGVGSGRSIIAGALTLGALVLPIVVITATEAIRAVPMTLREAGFGLGASRWQVVSRLLLPAAVPGILTGMVLALSRALGETAPLIVAGAVLGSFSADFSPGAVATGPYTALPVIVYDWARKPQEEFRELTAAAIVVLLLVTLLANAVAVVLRSRFERKW